MLEGSSVYDDEVTALVEKLNAKGIVLIVIEGEKNKNPIEYASALTAPMLPRVIEVLYMVQKAMEKDYLEVRKQN